MEEVYLRTRDYDHLEEIILPSSSWHSEAYFYKNPKDPNEIYKIYHNYTDPKYMNSKIIALSNLERFDKETKIPNIVYPSKALFIAKTFRGIALPKIDGTNASIVLDARYVPLSNKILILKQIGTILSNIRKYAKDKNAAYADVHGDNFMVEGINYLNYQDTSTINTVGIDSESMKLYDSPGITNFYLYNNGNIYDIDKYEANIQGITLPDSNTDIYCFIMMILKLISGEEDIYLFPVEDYYRYLDYLDKLGFDSHLLESFASVYQNDKDNIDPLPYLDQLTASKKTTYEEFKRHL